MKTRIFNAGKIKDILYVTRIFFQNHVQLVGLTCTNCIRGRLDYVGQHITCEHDLETHTYEYVCQDCGCKITAEVKGYSRTFDELKAQHRQKSEGA